MFFVCFFCSFNILKVLRVQFQLIGDCGILFYYENFNVRKHHCSLILRSLLKFSSKRTVGFYATTGV